MIARVNLFVRRKVLKQNRVTDSEPRTLSTLHCPGCGAPIPLGEGAEAVCPYCAQSSPLPPEYITLRDLERDRFKSRQSATTLLQSLAHPPGRFLRFLAGLPLKWVYLFGFAFLFVAVGVWVPHLLAAVSERIGTNLVDVVTSLQYLLLVGGMMFAMMGIPLALAAYGQRRALARRNLASAMAALPPDRPGGPARCHTCAAPLDVGEAAVSAPCFYCGSDNLVAVPEDWISRERGGVKSLLRTTEDASELDRKERLGTLRRLATELIILFLLIVPPLALIGYGGDSQNHGRSWPPRWRELAALEPRMLIHEPRPKDLYSYGWGVHANLAVNRDQRMAYDRAECADEDGVFCRRGYLIAMKRGEQLRLSSSRLPPGVTTLVVTIGRRRTGLFENDWMPIVKQAILRPGRDIDFAAPLNGWYRVDFMSTQEGAIPPASFGIHARHVREIPMP